MMLHLFKKPSFKKHKNYVGRVRTVISYKVYSNDLIHLRIEEGFFRGWPNPPSIEKHKEILEKSYKSIVAIDENKNTIIGFINAISDGVLSAYIPLLEVLPEYQKKGIGAELVRIMLNELSDIYMVDLSCDEDLQPYYERQGMIKSQGMMVRNYKYQAGR
jgi:ribosomal protein S18 acetylase RimI-like enzyme